MGEKDITEKTLEAYNDVFADILNGCLFNGEEIIREDALTDATPTSQYKADSGTIHEQERDVAKYWNDSTLVRIAFFGFENQTAIDTDMPLRICGYDGAQYRSQLNADKKIKDKSTGKVKIIKNKRYPVITLVLYFGNRPWNKPNSLFEVLDIPEKLKPFVTDYRFNIIDVPRMTPEQINLFKSDFQIVADFFVQKYRNKNYIPSQQIINHVDEVLKLLSTMNADIRFSESLNKVSRKENANMCFILDQIEKRGVKRGERRGERRGARKGKISNARALMNLNLITFEQLKGSGLYTEAELTEISNPQPITHPMN